MFSGRYFAYYFLPSTSREVYALNERITQLKQVCLNFSSHSGRAKPLAKSSFTNTVRNFGRSVRSGYESIVRIDRAERDTCAPPNRITAKPNARFPYKYDYTVFREYALIFTARAEQRETKIELGDMFLKTLFSKTHYHYSCAPRSPFERPNPTRWRL